MDTIKFEGLFSIISDLFDYLPSADVVEAQLASGQASVDYFMSYIHCALYLLPMGTITTIFSLYIGLMIFRVLISFIHTLWDLLPVA